MAEAPTTRPKPADPKRGTYVRCGRCKCTGEARYNHLNGDTHCYLCDGRGWQLRYSKAEREQIERENAWWGKARTAEYRLRLDVTSLARKAAWAHQGFVYHRLDNPTPPDQAQVEAWQARSRKAMTFWVGDGLNMMDSELPAA